MSNLAASLTLRAVNKSFGNVAIIRNVDLDIAAGEFVVFVGPSGCGKSTLLRLICGLESATSGDINIEGRRVNDVPAAQRGLALVFQSYALYPHMTVRQNMAFGLENLKTPKAEIDVRIAEAARMLRLEPYLARRPTALSGGQRQRVAIGRAIVREPRIFLFDEPLSNLDAELRVSMRAELIDLHRRLGSTMIYVTHDQVEAMTMADKIVVLRAGQVEQVGAPLELYNRPANQFVAGFIGSPRMNFLPGKVRASGPDGLAVEVEGLGTIMAGRRPAIPLDTPVTLGIRPEHLQQDERGVSFTVTAVEQLGGLSYIRAAPYDLVLQVAGQTQLAANTRVTLSLPADRLHVFDAAGAAVIAAEPARVAAAA
jgi:ABC-type sugar transport system ATPase subunit